MPAEKEILLQRRGIVEVKAYISNLSLVITQETPSGSFNGISLRIDKTLLKNMIQLTKELLAAIEEG